MSASLVGSEMCIRDSLKYAFKQAGRLVRQESIVDSRSPAQEKAHWAVIAFRAVAGSRRQEALAARAI
eukprot:15250179-Alexandrium_andersonii.AAC.1